MKTRSNTRAPDMDASSLFCVGMPDTQGGICFLSGYESDPTRYYTLSMALTFETWEAAEDAIMQARKTHPFRDRAYRILTVAEMETLNKDCEQLSNLEEEGGSDKE